MKTSKQNYKIDAPVAKVWKAFVDPKEIEAWGAGPAEMNDKEGSEFKLWGGDVWGKNLEVVPHKKLVQDWYGGKWEQPSKVTFTFSEVDGKTKVDLLQENVPDSEAADIDDGWKRYYLGEIKKYFENAQAH